MPKCTAEQMDSERISRRVIEANFQDGTTKDALQAQHFLPGAWPKGDAIGTRSGLQGRERVVVTDVGHVGHALLFDQMALAGQPRAGCA